MANEKQEYAELAEAYKKKTGEYPDRVYEIEELRALVNEEPEKEEPEDKPKKSLSSLSRKELDQEAITLGIDPREYSTKALLIEAIESRDDESKVEDPKKEEDNPVKKKGLIEVYDKDQKRTTLVTPLTWRFLKDNSRYEIRKTPKELQ